MWPVRQSAATAGRKNFLYYGVLQLISIMQNQTDNHRSRFHLSNMQVVAILVVAGSCLIGVTLMLAEDFRHIPLSLWDICTTPAEPVSPPADDHSGS